MVTALPVGGLCRARSQAPSLRSDGRRGVERSVQLVNTCLLRGNFGVEPCVLSRSRAPCCEVLVLSWGGVAGGTSDTGTAVGGSQDRPRGGTGPWRRRGDVRRRSSWQCGPGSG